MKINVIARGWILPFLCFHTGTACSKHPTADHYLRPSVWSGAADSWSCVYKFSSVYTRRMPVCEGGSQEQRRGKLHPGPGICPELQEHHFKRVFEAQRVLGKVCNHKSQWLMWCFISTLCVKRGHLVRMHSIKIFLGSFKYVTEITILGSGKGAPRETPISLFA